MRDVVEFLTARLADDERLAHGCIAEVGPERAGERYTDDSGDASRDSFPSYPWGSQEAELAYMAGPGHPSRVLAEVEAKRRLLRHVTDEPAWQMSSDEEYAGYGAALHETLHFLALPYAQHEDYRSEWKP